MGFHAYIYTQIRVPTLLYTDPPVSDVVQVEINTSDQNFNMSSLQVECEIYAHESLLYHVSAHIMFSSRVWCHFIISMQCCTRTQLKQKHLYIVHSHIQISHNRIDSFTTAF